MLRELEKTHELWDELTTNSGKNNRLILLILPNKMHIKVDHKLAQ